MFGSKRIQNIFEETFQNERSIKNYPHSSMGFNMSKPISENYTSQNFTIRKKSVDFKEKGLIVPATFLSFNPNYAVPSFPSVSHINSPGNYQPRSQINPQNYIRPMGILGNIPPVNIYQPNQPMKFPNMSSMNIVNNFTNIQNFSNEKETKNVHIYKDLNSVINQSPKEIKRNIFEVKPKKKENELKQKEIILKSKLNLKGKKNKKL